MVRMEKRGPPGDMKSAATRYPIRIWARLPTNRSFRSWSNRKPRSIQKSLRGKPLRSFILTAKYNADVLAVTQSNYFAARGVNCGLNSEPYDFYDIKGCTPDSLAIDIHGLTAQAELEGKWLAVYFHSLLGAEENGWGSYEFEEFTTYLDYLGARNVWVGTFEKTV